MSTLLNKKRTALDFVALGFVAFLVLNYRYFLLKNYSFLYTDSDQNIMWGALKDYASGHFYETRFYGQNYSTFLEALLAVPLYKLGYQPYTALPFVSMCLCVFPFFYLGLFTFLKRSVFYGLVICSLPLLLPFEYAIITGMPRGFVTGLPFAAMACTAYFYEEQKRFYFLSGFMSVLAFTINTNAVLLCLPLLVYLWLQNLKHLKFYLLTASGLLLGLLVHLALNYVYVKDPFYNTHQFELHFYWSYFADSLKYLDYFLNYNTPVLWHQGSLALIVFLGIGLFLLKQKQTNLAYAVLLIIPMVLLTFGINKVHDGTSSIYFHQARMYLSFPLLLAFAFSALTPSYEPKIYYLWLIIPLYFYQGHLSAFEKNFEKITKYRPNDIVIVSHVKPIVDDCKRLNKVCKDHKVDLFIIANHFYFDAYASGCESCESDFPLTYNGYKERRTWRMRQIDKQIYKNILLIDMDNKLDTTLSFIKKIPGTIDLYLVKNNRLNTFQLLDTLHIKYRAFK